MGIIKGQNLRLKIASKVVAASTSCQIHVAAQLEDSSTKDDTASWSSQEVIVKSWDGSADALVVIASGTETEEGLVAFDALNAVGTTVAIEFGVASGDKNRTITKKYSGNAIINDVSLTAGNKQNATYTIQFTGVGALNAEA